MVETVAAAKRPDVAREAFTGFAWAGVIRDARPKAQEKPVSGLLGTSY